MRTQLLTCFVNLSLLGAMSFGCSAGETSRDSVPQPSNTPNAPASPSGTAPAATGSTAPSSTSPTDPSSAGPSSTGTAQPSATAPQDPAPNMGPVAAHGQLRVEGNQLLDAQDAQITLRGQGFGWDNWWPQYYNADVVNWLADDWCVDIVRPAMGIEPDGAYLANPTESRARIAAVVDAAIAKGVYVIIDWHAHDAHLEEATAFFTDMAQTYGEHPNVLYEVFNEPDEETWPDVKAYVEAVGAAIRQHDPDNLIIVGTPEWNQRIDLAVEDPITSLSNVIYSVHFYASTHTDWLRARTADALAAGLPIIVSESSGSEASGMGANNYDEWQLWFDFMDGNGISWINYSVSDKAGETISVLEPGAPASGGWDASHLTESGEYIRDVFRSHCQ